MPHAVDDVLRRSAGIRAGWLGAIHRPKPAKSEDASVIVCEVATMRLRVLQLLASFLLMCGGAALFFTGCNHDEMTGNSIQECQDQMNVLVNDPEYAARPETLTPAPGRLTKNCQTNSRYCYYIESAPVFTQGNQTVLDPFVNERVMIVGKVVFPAGGGSGELWAGTICRFR